MACPTCGRQWDPTEGDFCPFDGERLVAPSTATAIDSHPHLQLVLDRRTTDELTPGTMVGEYRIEGKIGAGGMGIVYGAMHPVIGKRAAIKVLNRRYSADGDAVERFVLEAQAVNRVGHSGIVDVFAFGELPDGRSYFVMEWLHGETLGHRLTRGPLPAAETIAILAELARALEAAHGAGVIHRDLKPENVFLVAESDRVHVKLLDFGIAKLTTNLETTLHRTATGVVVGTPLFMSPEQAKGLPVDTRTDVYSLGVLGYVMLSGTTPFQDETSAVEVLSAHISKPPPPLGREVPREVAELVFALLAKDPDDRPPLTKVRRMALTSPVVAPRRRRVTARAIAGGCAIGVVAVTILVLREVVAPAPTSTTAELTKSETKDGIVADAPQQGAITFLDATIVPVDAQMMGFLVVAVTPKTARITIEGRDHDPTTGLVPGEYEVSAAAPGWHTLTQRAVVVAGERRDITIVLKPSRTVPVPKMDTDRVHDPFK